MISRRRVLAGIAGIAGATAFGPVRVFAAEECTAVDAEARQCTVGIDIGVETVRQRCDNWCWAACIQTIFAVHNHDVAQESAVEKIFGSDPQTNCQPAGDAEIVAAINGRWVDAYGAEFTATAETLPMSTVAVSASQLDPTQTDPAVIATNLANNMFFRGDDLRVIVNELENNNPLILARMGVTIGHAVVLTAMSYVEHASGWIDLTEMAVRDPWPESLNLRRLSSNEILNTFSLIKVTVQG
jgi:hypothetical protein